MNERLQAAVLDLLDHGRRALMAAALLGVALHMDLAASDSTAPKWFWLGLAGGLLPALAGLRLWWGGRLHLAPPRLLVASLALAGAVTLAYLASPHRGVSTAGWQAWLMLLLLWLAAVDLLAEEGGRRWLLDALGLAAGLAGAWSLAQRLGLDPSAVGRLSLQSFGPRIAGPLGNPNFAGGFFALALPLLLHQALLAPEPWRRRAHALFALLALLGLGLSASKAAAFGLATSLAVAGHLLFWSPAPGPLRRKALLGLGATLLAGILAALLLLQAPARQRLLGGPTAWEESVGFRRLTWAGTLAMARERPLWGWGPGTFSVAYPAHRLPEAMRGQVQHSYEVSHPENWVLQLAAELGLLGLAAWLALLALLLGPLRRLSLAWHEDADAALALALLAALAGSLACNLASLDLFLPSTALPFTLLAALAVVLGAGKAPAVSINPEPYARLLVSFGLALMASVPVVHGQMRWQSSRLLLQGKALSQAGRFGEAVPRYRLAVDLDPLNLEARYFWGRSLQDQGPAKLGEAEAVYQDLSRLAPDYVLLHAHRARLYTAQGRLDLAEASWRRQLKLDPYLLQAVQELGDLLAGQGRLAEAAQVLEEAAPRFPDNADIQSNLRRLRRGRGGKP